MIYIPKTSIRFIHNKECILAQLTLKDCLGCKVIPGMWPLQPNRYSEGKDACCLETFLFSIIVYTFETMCFCHRPYTTISMLVRSAAVLLYITVQSHRSSRFSQAKVAISFELVFGRTPISTLHFQHFCPCKSAIKLNQLRTKLCSVTFGVCGNFRVYTVLRI